MSLLVGEIRLAARREPAIEHRREDGGRFPQLRMRESFRGDLTFLWIARRDVGVVLDRSLRALDAEHYVECPRQSLRDRR